MDIATRKLYGAEEFDSNLVKEWLKSFGENGGDPNWLKRTADSPDAMLKLVRYGKCGHEVFATQIRAKDIIGENMIEFDEVARLFPQFTQLNGLCEIPYPEPMLRGFAQTCVLFPGLPMRLGNFYSMLGISAYFANNRCEAYSFVNKFSVFPRWYLMGIQEYPGSFGMVFKKQTRLVGGNFIPYVCEVIFMAGIYRLLRGVTLFSDYFVNCQDVDNGKQLCVGMFDSASGVIHIEHTHASRHSSKIGIAYAVSPPK